jgi:hypothetical protein
MSLFFTLIYNNGKPGIPFLATNMEADWETNTFVSLF